MKNKTRYRLFFLLYLSVFIPSILLSQNLKMIGVRVWDSEKKIFGGLSDIEIQKGVIQSIRPTSGSKKEIVRYLLPGFCDASVTIGADSFGGGVSKENLPYHLQSFLSTGFSHVESVADPDLQKVKEEISKGRLVGPIISQSQKPVVLPSHFPETDQPSKQYDLVTELENTSAILKEQANRSQILPIFLKRSSNQSFTQTDLFHLRTDAEKLGFTPVIYSFTDPLSWEDALDSGYKIIFHGLPPNANLEPIQRRSYLWAPMLNISYIKSLKENPSVLRSKLKNLTKYHPVFRDKFFESFDAILTEEGDRAKADRDKITFSNLNQSLRQFPKDRLLFASGAGHYGSFPGIGAMIEAEIWLDSWKLDGLVSDIRVSKQADAGFWQKIWGTFSPERILQRPNRDENTIHEGRKDLVEILTKATCSFIKADHKGLIKEGGPAHFSVHKENPFVSPLGIFAIESMVLGGKLVYTPKPEKVGKKP